MSDGHLRIIRATEISDEHAKHCAEMGVTGFLRYIDQAVAEQTEKVTGALSYICQLATAVYAEHGGRQGAVEAPESVGELRKLARAQKPEVRRLHHMTESVVETDAVCA